MRDRYERYLLGEIDYEQLCREAEAERNQGEGDEAGEVEQAGDDDPAVADADAAT